MLKAKLAADVPGALGSHSTAPIPRHTGEITEWVVAAACRGEHKAFAAVLRHYDRRLRLVAYRLLRDRDLVDDALQDVALKAFQALPQFRGEASLGTWLHRITHTTCLDYLRRNPPLELVPTDELPEAHHGAVADTAELVVERDHLKRRLTTLPPEQRLTVLLVGHGGYDYRSAAQILGVAPGTVGSRLNTAHVALRRRLC